MILVDIYVPALDCTYDFQVDENVAIQNLIVEIAEMISNETKSLKKTVEQNFLLCSTEQNKIFKKTCSLHDYGIKNGSKLMLV